MLKFDIKKSIEVPEKEIFTSQCPNSNQNSPYNYLALSKTHNSTSTDANTNSVNCLSQIIQKPSIPVTNNKAKDQRSTSMDL